MISCFVLFVKNYALTDTIKIHEDFLESSRFGKVYYEQIVSVLSPAWHTKPCIKLTLDNGKEVFWGAWGSEDAILFKKKIEANNHEIERLIDALAVKLKADPNSLTNKMDKISEKSHEKQKEVVSSAKRSEIGELGRQMEEVKDKNNNQKWPAIIVSLLFSLFLLFRACSNF